MFVLSSPSGAGKTTLVRKISKIKILKFQYLIQQGRLDQMKKMERTISLYQKVNLKANKKANF